MNNVLGSPAISTTQSYNHRHRHRRHRFIFSEKQPNSKQHHPSHFLGELHAFLDGFLSFKFLFVSPNQPTVSPRFQHDSTMKDKILPRCWAANISMDLQMDVCGSGKVVGSTLSLLVGCLMVFICSIPRFARTTRIHWCMANLNDTESLG